MYRSSPEKTSFDPASSRISQVLQDAVDLFLQAPHHDRDESRAFGDLVCGLLPDVSPADRLRTSRLLSARPDLPPSVARHLAADEAEIAAPMIIHSPVLTSADLVQIMRCGPHHVRLVAERLDLAPDLAASLTGTQDRAAKAASPAPSEGERSTPATTAERSFGRRRTEPAKPEEPPVAAVPPMAQPIPTSEPARTIEPAGIDEPERPNTTPPAPLVAELEGAVAADTFFLADSAGRWRAIQEATALAAVTAGAPRRRRAGDPSLAAGRLFGAAVLRDREAFERELCEALDLDAALAARIFAEESGEPLAVALAALGIDGRTSTSILLLHAGEAATLGAMQDLAALTERVGWRAADHLLSIWRDQRSTRRGETTRVLDPAERRDGARSNRLGGERDTTSEANARRAGTDR